MDLDLSATLPRKGTDAQRPVDLRKVLRLFDDDATADLAGRQADVVTRVCRKNANGYRFGDMPLLGQLVRRALDGVDARADDRFVIPLCGLVSLLKKPFLRAKANEEQQQAHSVGELVQAVAAALSCSDDRVRWSAANALRVFLRGQTDAVLPRTDASDDQRESRRAFAQRVAVQADVLPAVVAALHAELDSRVDGSAAGGGGDAGAQSAAQTAGRARDADGPEDDLPPRSEAPAPGERRDDVSAPPSAAGRPGGRAGGRDGDAPRGASPATTELARAIGECAAEAPTARAAVACGGTEALLRVVAEVDDFRDAAVAAAVGSLWELFERSEAEGASGPPARSRRALARKRRTHNALFHGGTESGVDAVATLLDRTLRLGHRQSDKELRNEAVVLLSLLASRAASRPAFVSTGALQLLVQHACAPETGMPTLAPGRAYATACAEDLEFKLLAWSVACTVAKPGRSGRPTEAARVLATSPLPAVLLLYLRHHDREAHPATQAAGTAALSRTGGAAGANGATRAVYVSRWSPAQLRSLQIAAADALTSLAPSLWPTLRDMGVCPVAVDFLARHLRLRLLPSDPRDSADLADGRATALGGTVGTVAAVRALGDMNTPIPGRGSGPASRRRGAGAGVDADSDSDADADADADADRHRGSVRDAASSRGSPESRRSRFGARQRARSLRPAEWRPEEVAGGAAPLPDRGRARSALALLHALLEGDEAGRVAARRALLQARADGLARALAVQQGRAGDGASVLPDAGSGPVPPTVTAGARDPAASPFYGGDRVAAAMEREAAAATAAAAAAAAAAAGSEAGREGDDAALGAASPSPVGSASTGLAGLPLAGEAAGSTATAAAAVEVDGPESAASVLGECGAVELMLVALADTDLQPGLTVGRTAAGAGLSLLRASSASASTTLGGGPASATQGLGAATAGTPGLDVPAREVRDPALCLAARLCAGHLLNQTRFRRAGGIELALTLLAGDGSDRATAAEKLASATWGGRNPFGATALGGTKQLSGSRPAGASGRAGPVPTGRDEPLHAVALVWAAAVGNRRSETRLLALGGADLLLEALDTAAAYLRPPLLGCLADLARNKHASPFMLQWRSEVSLRSAAQVIVRLWREEEARRGIRHDDDSGVVCNLHRPLDGSESKQRRPNTPPRVTQRLQRALQASERLAAAAAAGDRGARLQAAADAVDLRDRLHALLHALGLDRLAEGVDAEDRAVLVAAERLPEFREAAALLEAKAELGRRGLHPVRSDAMALEHGLDRGFQVAVQTKVAQTELMREARRGEAEREEAFLELMKEQRRQAATADPGAAQRRTAAPPQAGGGVRQGAAVEIPVTGRSTRSGSE